MRRTFDRGAVVMIVVVIILVVGNVALAYRNAARVAGTGELVTHTQEVLSALNRVLASVIDAETGERGYVITGNDEYLKPLQAAEHRTAQDVAHVAALTNDSPVQQGRIADLRRLVGKRLDVLRLGVAVQQQQGIAAARALILTDAGRVLTDSLRATIDAMSEQEHQLLNERVATYDDSRAFALGTTIVGGAISLVLIAVITLVLSRELRARTLAANTLAAQKEVLRTTLASIGDGVITTDAGGRVTFVNGIAEALTGWRAEDALEQRLERVFVIVNETTRAPVENPAVRALRDGAIVGLANHTVLIAKDLRETAIDDSAAPILDAQGSMNGAVLVFRDITERRRTERALHDAARSKDEFLAMLAHELRNPLAPISNALELLRRSEHDASSVERLRAMMHRQVQQLVRLTDDLLDVSRITRNKLSLQMETVDLRTVVHGAMETSGPLLAQQRHVVEQSLPSEPVMIQGDRARLQQMLYNLVGNAAKYTDPGGNIRVGIAREDGLVTISVKDDGIGIAPDMLERVFDLFTQADRSLARSQGGLGIGLTLVRQIAEMHGGSVLARSDGRGHGSEFVVTIPLLA